MAVAEEPDDLLDNSIDNRKLDYRGVSMVWANDFSEILTTLAVRPDLRTLMHAHVGDPIPGKVTEGPGRADAFRAVLRDLIDGVLELEESYDMVVATIPRDSSPHASNNKVFPVGWAERLVRTQLSRHYNHAVLDAILAANERHCYVPHSSLEDVTSSCTQALAGQNHDAAILRERLVNSYARGIWGKEPKLPDHPHCTHVAHPVAGSPLLRTTTD